MALLRQTVEPADRALFDAGHPRIQLGLLAPEGPALAGSSLPGRRIEAFEPGGDLDREMLEQARDWAWDQDWRRAVEAEVLGADPPEDPARAYAYGIDGPGGGGGRCTTPVAVEVDGGVSATRLARVLARVLALGNGVVFAAR